MIKIVEISGYAVLLNVHGLDNEYLSRITWQLLNSCRRILYNSIDLEFILHMMGLSL